MSRRPVAPPPKQRSGTGRTIILVAVASIVAGLIIGRGLSNDSSSATGSNSGGTGAGGNGSTATTKKPGKNDPTTTTQALPTTTTQPPVVLGNFTAIVLNGNGIPGTAGARTGELAALGVKTVKAADATVKNYETSAIYALSAESEAAAKAVSTKSGITYGGIYPTATPPAPVEKLANATIILLLGKDVANKPITDVSGGGATATVAPAAATPTTTA